MGLALNFWVLFIVWLAGVLDPPELSVDGLPFVEIIDGKAKIPNDYAFVY